MAYFTPPPMQKQSLITFRIQVQTKKNYLYWKCFVVSKKWDTEEAFAFTINIFSCYTESNSFALSSKNPSERIAAIYCAFKIIFKWLM